MKKRRIGLVVLSNPSWMGGVNYVINWVKALRLLPEKEKPFINLLYRDERGREIAESLKGFVDDINPFKGAASLNLDIVYPVTQVFEAPFDCPWAGWIPDWQCKHLPEMFDELEIARRDLHYGILARKSSVLAVSSQMAYDDTIRVIGSDISPLVKLTFPAVLDDSVYNWTERDLKNVVKKYHLPEKFFIVCNKFWKHKNPFVVFKALEKIYDRQVQCVFTGDTTDHRWPEYFREIETFVADKGLTEHVHLIGQVSREDQLKLIRAAHAVIQPSKFEGWSSIVEEAKALNKTLIVSNFPVHREQAEGFGHFFEPDDAVMLAELMLKLWQADAPLENKEDLTAHKLKYQDYVRNCARQFMKLAELTAGNYNPEINDPKPIIAGMLPYILEKKGDTTDKLYQKAVSGTRVMFKGNSGQLEALMDNIKAKYPEYYGYAERDIFKPLGFQAGSDNRLKKRSLIKKIAGRLFGSRY